ncbi:MAG: type II secretion system F family protein [Clostridia bacterium]|nr:type II secretion system F family protein [Clostridia bacterium]
MVYVIIAASFFSLYMLFYVVFGAFYKKRMAINIRLDRISMDAAKNENDELNQPIFVRIVRPVLDDISKTIIKITPKEIVTVFEKRVTMAGSPFNLTVRDWINLQVVAVFCFPILIAALGYYKNFELRNTIFISAAGIGMGLILPTLILSKYAAERQKKITNSLPDVLDLLTVSVEAGLGFDGALAKVIDKMPGPLSAEFENVLQEMKVGKHKRDALKDMVERVGVQDLTTFVNSIVQADQLGVSIGNVLRIQSEQMRQKRRQRAQEKAMKAPVKMLIPMILFVFPTIFSVLIGPIAIKMIRTFMK